MIVRVSIRSCHWLPVLFVNNQTDKQISKHLLVFVRVFVSSVACSRLSDSGEDAKEKVREKFIFVFVLSQFSGPDYLGAWNRLCLQLRFYRQKSKTDGS